MSGLTQAESDLLAVISSGFDPEGAVIENRDATLKMLESMGYIRRVWIATLKGQQFFEPAADKVTG